ncbi:MAG: hypothetical protein A3C11_03390 [Candidatus Sungbacteria bacterium RIFCSPHIGHO2_02_FULL_49_12]|uniref:Uncharacterized protein n=1 Tax=Candidatus Sungbacteria bacterium RIFCSPHIGHO2_02_FULL_49_12 TaxID=1802271 RepID=A0A1G2KQU3_9BACT|nr:MAG: hypothetical protein A3C11_03390 [Candidatus Sungbacteria bacterium RIFCSPHIGHO2_02_FULL_49_12]
MTFVIAITAFLGFIIFYIVFASAVVYHLNAFSLPTWTGRRISLIIFTLLSLILAGIATTYFFQVPWDSYVIFT